jgi:hypothetical protein
MHVQLYLILEPGADRPYICHHYPESYPLKEGAKVFEVELDVPGFEMHERVIQIAPTSVVELTERKMAPDMIEGTQFTCPRCGSHYFGSSDLPGEGFQYECHGQAPTGIPCTFTCTREESNLYFKVTGHFSPKVVVGTTGTP